MGKRKGKCAKKNSATKQGLEPENLVKAPHSFVIHRGHCGKDLVDLTKDFRKVMEPFTASQLKVRLLCLLINRNRNLVFFMLLVLLVLPNHVMFLVS